MIGANADHVLALSLKVETRRKSEKSTIKLEKRERTKCQKWSLKATRKTTL